MSHSKDHRPMSIEAMLDEERRDVLTLLENRPRARLSPDETRAQSIGPSPRSPIRSMLDLDPTTYKTTSAQQAPVRSMLDFDGPPSPRVQRFVASADTSPVLSKSTPLRRNDPYADYQYEAPRKVSGDTIGADRTRHMSIAGSQAPKSMSPHSTRRLRSRSPAPYTASLLPPHTAILDDGSTFDMRTAYRRLSDANLAYSDGSLAQLARGRPTSRTHGRLIKDEFGPDGEPLESSEEEPISSDDEDRGRKKSRGKGPENPLGQPEDREAKSLLAAAEAERSLVMSQQPAKQTYTSLIPEPEITVTSSSGETSRSARNVVHPHTSFDPNVPMSADEEAELNEIRTAQNMSFSVSSMPESPSVPRTVKIVDRGGWTKIVKNEDDDRFRKYLVATDLSEEAAYALEWAIGTLLRDGDTLIAMYCIEESSGADNSLVPDEAKLAKEQDYSSGFPSSNSSSKLLPSASAMAESTRRLSTLHFRSGSGGTPAASPAPSGRGDKTRAEEERDRAANAITERVLKLLRRTILQVRVIIEVVYCKVPRQLVTEAIDLIDPTMVVIGSRGRSALKGVILGSFSNYLVTKSSVPVMVARKRLRKQSKEKKVAPWQANNLRSPSARGLENAKVD